VQQVRGQHCESEVSVGTRKVPRLHQVTSHTSGVGCTLLFGGRYGEKFRVYAANERKKQIHLLELVKSSRQFMPDVYTRKQQTAHRAGT
jgi:tRNA splicing endonuclease